MGDAHSATDFHFLFLNPPALTNFTDDQRPRAEEKLYASVPWVGPWNGPGTVGSSWTATVYLRSVTQNMTVH